jgi:hypothetical protein
MRRYPQTNAEKSAWSARGMLQLAPALIVAALAVGAVLLSVGVICGIAPAALKGPLG